MSLSHHLVLAAACVSFLAASTVPPVPRNLLQLHNMIKCAIPSSNPLMEYADYGCYCGFGGSGTPVDNVDMCCQIHDDCYSQSKKHPACRFLVDNPYTKTYSYSCSRGNITCTDDQDKCAAFICNCDRAVAICFAGVPYNEEYKNLDTSKYCK